MLLLSRLAEHTRNLEQDDRVSPLLDGSGACERALAGERVTVQGRLRPRAEAGHRARHLACHPVAAMYLSFTQAVRAGESARVELLRFAELARRRLSLAS